LWIFSTGSFGKGNVTSDDDDDVLLLDISEESVAGRMVSTPLQGHPAAIDMSDVISSIHGNLFYIDLTASHLHSQSVVFFAVLSFYNFVL